MNKLTGIHVAAVCKYNEKQREASALAFFNIKLRFGEKAAPIDRITSKSQLTEETEKSL